MAATLGAFTVSLGGCGSDDTIPACRNAPTYADNIRPLTEATCLPCHSEQLAGRARQGAPKGLNYDSFALIEPNVQTFANAFTSGTMPPVDSGSTVSRANRRIVAFWRQCGFLP